MPIPKLQTPLLLILLIHLTTSVVDRTYYIYLGLDISASGQEIRQAYHNKKIKLQSLQEGDVRNSKTRLLEEAYEVLGSPEKRSLYDRLNKDLIRKESVVSSLKRITDKGNRKEKTFLMTLPVSTEDVYHGKTIYATYLKQTACQKCKGTGADSPKSLNTCSRCGGNGFTLFEGVNPYGQKFVNQNTCQGCQGHGKQVTKVCPVCQGKKLITKTQKVKIKIPKGLPDGPTLKIPNFGPQPLLGAPSDAQIKIIEIPTQRWARQGQNLIHTLPITFQQAIFGFKKTITHLSGEQIVIERPGVVTRATTVTIPGKGIENVRTGKAGKLTVRFRIVMPKFNDQQLDMWEQFFDQHKL